MKSLPSATIVVWGSCGPGLGSPITEMNIIGTLLLGCVDNKNVTS